MYIAHPVFFFIITQYEYLNKLYDFFVKLLIVVKINCHARTSWLKSWFILCFIIAAEPSLNLPMDQVLCDCSDALTTDKPFTTTITKPAA